MWVEARVKRAIEARPLELIIVIALLARMIAAVFSKGFGMHDDHFLVIEPAKAWADGMNYQGWLPGGRSDVQPDGHSVLYSGIHYLIFRFFSLLGLSDPQMVMLIIRIMHGLFSLWVISLGYRITKRIGGEKQAFTAGVLLALLWFMPMLSVRNLVEMVCIPFILAGSWHLITAEDSARPWLKYLIAGLLMGLGFSIRFQTAIFIGGTGLALLLMTHWKGTLLFGIGVLAAIIPIQGGIDYFIWGYPFAEFGEYVRYNIQAAHDYITGPWYNYLLLLFAILLPPVSVFLITGFFRLWRTQLILWLPSFLFLVFHSIFPNKQERFIFPILAHVVILGVVGYYLILEHNNFWQRRKKFLRGSWVFFWIVNLLLLFAVTVSYSKRARVEAMTYLSVYDPVNVLLLEDTQHGDTKMVPQFYLGQWVQVISKSQNGLSWYCPFPECDSSRVVEAAFVCFYGEENLEKRVAELKEELPGLEYETTISPGFLDIIMYRLNPVNLNQRIVIYRNKEIFPVKKVQQ